jgi:dUTP pyrophosphatase
MEAQIRPRSGLSLRYPNYIANSPGTIDADFRGEIQIMFINNTDDVAILKHGQRLAQLVFCSLSLTKPRIIETDKLTETERGAGGYGHTGL